MASIFFGTAAVTGGAAATGGLFGTAGAFGLAQTAATVGMGAAIYSQVQAGDEGAMAARNQQTMMDYNADMARREAASMRTAGQYKQVRTEEASQRGKSTMLSRMGWKGTPGAGTNILVEGEQAEEDAIENLLIGYESSVGASRAESQANLDTMQGSIYGQKARNIKTASRYKAGSTLLTGLGRIYG